MSLSELSFIFSTGEDNNEPSPTGQQVATTISDHKDQSIYSLCESIVRNMTSAFSFSYFLPPSVPSMDQTIIESTESEKSELESCETSEQEKIGLETGAELLLLALLVIIEIMD